MALLDPLRKSLEKRKQAKTRKDIHDALTRAYEHAETAELAADERVVILSDQHKGARDGADDFQRCERAYNAALAYYNALGYRLVELGDVEELWENTLDEVLPSYERTLRLAAAFFQQGAGYTRLYGNHDLAWKDTDYFRSKMGAYGYADIEPIEALKVLVKDAAGEPLVELFLAHGHQGTASSDRYAFFSKVFVRFGWRRLQRLINRPWNTPSQDWKLRGAHAEDMELWASANKHVLIAGHTHMPVFFQSQKAPAEPPADLATGASDPAEAEALRLARLQWAAAEVVRLSNQPPITLATPCYFNTGCCSFGDGDITGIEIRDGEIRLIRWASAPETAPDVLASMTLAEVESAVNTLG